MEFLFSKTVFSIRLCSRKRSKLVNNLKLVSILKLITKVSKTLLIDLAMLPPVPAKERVMLQTVKLVFDIIVTFKKETAMACTVAVEESITEHYNDQIRELLKRDPELHSEMIQLLKEQNGLLLDIFKILIYLFLHVIWFLLQISWNLAFFKANVYQLHLNPF